MLFVCDFVLIVVVVFRCCFLFFCCCFFKINNQVRFFSGNALVIFRTFMSSNNRHCDHFQYSLILYLLKLKISVENY